MKILNLGTFTNTTAGSSNTLSQTPFQQGTSCVLRVLPNPLGALVFTLEGSQDGSSWAVLSTVTIAVAGQATAVNVNLAARYVRGKCSAVTAGQCEALLEGGHS